jgi:hypothetical protein
MKDFKLLTIDELGQLQEETILKADKLFKSEDTKDTASFLMQIATLIGELILAKQKISDLETKYEKVSPGVILM